MAAAEPPGGPRESRLGDVVAFALPLLVVLPILVGAVIADPLALVGILCWFDPILLIYNVLLVGVAMSVPTFVVYAYVQTMRGEKLRRLEHDLGADWPRHAEAVRQRQARLARFGGYLGGVIATTVLTGFGATILLLVKPLPLGQVLSRPAGLAADACAGLDFGRGASFLLLGWLTQYLDDPATFYPTLMLALTAFQFGFLGAWIYFLASLTRDYFACDLTPSSLINGGIRMATASLLALVVSFGLPLVPGLSLPPGPVLTAGLSLPAPGLVPEGGETLIRLMPILAFFFGYFPSEALLVIQRLVGRTLGALLSGPGTLTPRPLSDLAGVSYLHEVRLGQEGIDNVANLADADPLDLALRTGFRLQQLRRWVDEAWLARHLGEDYGGLVRASGVAGRQDLRALIEAAGTAGQDPVALLAGCLAEAERARLKPKLEIVCALAAAR